MEFSNLRQTILSLHPSPFATPENEIKTLITALEKKTILSEKTEETLNQINALHYSGFISSFTALRLKNNLHDPILSESILSEQILELISQEKLIPEARQIVKERGFANTILYLHTVHLQALSSKLEPSIVQQQVLKHEPTNLFLRMKEAEEMNAKKEIKQWLQTIELPQEDLDLFVTPLLKPLTDSQFKESALSLLQHLYAKEDNLIFRFCFEEVHTLLQKESEEKSVSLIAQFLKALNFYYAHTCEIQQISLELLDLDPILQKQHIQTCRKAHQFSLLIAADAIKNAPRARDLETVYSLMAGRIKTQWEEAANILQKDSFKAKHIIARGISKDEEIASRNIEEILKTNKKSFDSICIPYEIFSSSNGKFFSTETLAKKHHAFRVVNLFSGNTEENSEKNVKKLMQQLLKKTPSSLIAPLSHHHKHLTLETAKALNIPVTFVAINTDISEWEDLSYSHYPHFTIAFPTPPDPNIPQEINKEKMVIAGLPVIQRSFEESNSLKQKWGIPLEKQVILINTPEGDLTWPTFIAKHYSEDKNIFLIILTEEKKKQFLHTLQTKLAPSTQLPIRVCSSLTPKEKEELLILANLVIDKNKQGDSAILLESNKTGTRLLIDNTPPSFFSRGLLGFSISCLNAFLEIFGIKNQLPETILHENFLEEQNLGKMVHSKKDFKKTLENLLLEDSPVTIPPENFTELFPKILDHLEKTAPKNTLVKNHFNPFKKDRHKITD